ncbi:MAG: flippase-like domain-containing protein, partial [Actinobacteria bacterium]|nr:flippase-like domain-containing protein [Actinomycetota bacterium]
IAIGAAAVVVLAGIAWALPFGRRFVRDTILPAVRRSAQGIVAVAKRPLRLVSLIGGTAGVTLSYTGALFASVAAFYGDVPFVPVAIVFLLGNFVQAVAPTPGGLGAAEAAYIGGLTAIGLPSEQAVAAVLVYRFFTFFAPVLPGWFAMMWLQRSEAI